MLVSFIHLLLITFLVETNINQSQNDCISSAEKELHEIINDYRATTKLPAIALSPKLSKVAKAHAKDLVENYDFDPKNKCNPHSWSSEGEWRSCCYTNDHKEAECMWKKPMEIANYPSYGYEIIYYHSKQARPKAALVGWQGSKSHDPIIMNKGMWKDVAWKAMGVGIYKNYAVVWFGQVEDKEPVDYCE